VDAYSVGEGHSSEIFTPCTVPSNARRVCRLKSQFSPHPESICLSATCLPNLEDSEECRHPKGFAGAATGAQVLKNPENRRIHQNPKGQENR
jgi:hypothetical protein